MSMTLKEEAWQSGLVLSEEPPEWNFEDWPPLEGGWRECHASVVLNHPDNNKEQTVVASGGYQQGKGTTDSVLALDLAESNKQWRYGPPMNKKRYDHAAVVCNGAVYVMGGFNGNLTLSCIERIDTNDLVQSSLTKTTTQESHWTTLTCRLSTGRFGCCAVAVHNRYIVVVGGYNDDYLSSVDIIDTRNHTVTAGQSMNIPRFECASAVIGHRIFVVGGRNKHGNLDSVEYLDFAEETKDGTLSTAICFSSSWITHSELVLSNVRSSCAVVTVGSCLVVAGGWRNTTVEVLDTNRNRVWNLPPFVDYRRGCNMVTVANHVAVIGGWDNPTCATLQLLDRNSWCFRQLCEQPRNKWYHCLERSSNGDVNVTSSTISTSTLKRFRTNT